MATLHNGVVVLEHMEVPRCILPRIYDVRLRIRRWARDRSASIFFALPMGVWEDIIVEVLDCILYYSHAGSSRLDIHYFRTLKSVRGGQCRRSDPGTASIHGALYFLAYPGSISMGYS